MTEEQAKKTWCLRGPTPSKSEHCIGSACSQWRRLVWVTDQFGSQREAPLGSGYCGLAGVPQ